MINQQMFLGHPVDELQANHDAIHERLAALKVALKEQLTAHTEITKASIAQAEKGIQGPLKDPVTITNAALADAGMEPTAGGIGEDNILYIPFPNGASEDDMHNAYRAGVLGVIGYYGPDTIIRCFNCSLGMEDEVNLKENCIRAQDALMGAVCDS